MFVAKGKTNWALVISVAVIAGAAGGMSVLYINDTIQQSTMLSQSAELKILPKNTAACLPLNNEVTVPAAAPATDGTGTQIPAGGPEVSQ